MTSDYNFTGVCSVGPNKQYPSIGSDTCVNQCWLVYRRIYTSLGLNEFKQVEWACRQPDRYFVSSYVRIQKWSSMFI